jgi:hypothetical protein
MTRDSGTSSCERFLLGQSDSIVTLLFFLYPSDTERGKERACPGAGEA